MLCFGAAGGMAAVAAAAVAAGAAAHTCTTGRLHSDDEGQGAARVRQLAEVFLAKAPLSPAAVDSRGGGRGQRRDLFVGTACSNAY